MCQNYQFGLRTEDSIKVDFKNMENGFRSTLLTLSDLYARDLPEGAVLVSKRPSSCGQYEDGEIVSDFYKNDNSLDLYEDHRPYHSATAGKLYAVMFMPFAGPNIEVVNDYTPKRVLIEHWVRKLGKKYEPKFCGVGSNKIHLVQFPMNGLKPHLHVMDPIQMYRIFSKKLIEEINCPQAQVYTEENVTFPCLVKSSLTVAGRAVFRCYNRESFDTVIKDHHDKNIPYVINKLVTNVENEFCVQYYVSKDGTHHFVGATQPMFSKDGIWVGSNVDLEKQPLLAKKFDPTIKPVADKLRDMGFYGYVGMDVLVDKNNEQYVVDINPRLNHSTPLLLGGLKFQMKGWTHGIYLQDFTEFMGSEDDLIKAAESIENGDVLVLTCARTNNCDKTLKCLIAIYSTSFKACWDILFHVTGIEKENKQKFLHKPGC